MLRLKLFIINFFIKHANKINITLKKRKYLIIFRYGKSIGDHLYMTSVISKIFEKKFKIIVLTNYPELFINNPKVYKIFNLNKYFNRKILLRIFEVIQGESIKSFGNKISGTDKYSFMKFYPRNIHLAGALSYHFNMGLNFDNFKNEIYLSENEIKNYRKKLNLPNNYAVIHSEAKITYTKNKNWGHERIQNIINELDKINWIQIGTPNEFKLNNTYKSYFNLSLRELAYLIYNSRFLVSMEGLYNHIASAFNKKNFLIHTGFLHIDSFKYSNNILIEKNLNLDCYPCYELNCKNHKPHCENILTSRYAIEVIKKNLNY